MREITAEELAAKAGYSRPHTLHCGPGGIFMSAIGGANGNDGPGGVALLDHDTFDVVGPGSTTAATSTSPTTSVAPELRHRHHLRVGHPSMIEHGLNPEDLLGRKFGHHLNFWSMSERKLIQRIDLGDPTRWCWRSAWPTTRPRRGGSSA